LRKEWRFPPPDLRPPEAIDSETRELTLSAKGADARRQVEEELARPWGGALDTATVLRVFLKTQVYPTNPHSFVLRCG
jgi:hypothetical protein